MIEQVNGFITPMKEWNAVGKNDETTGAKIGTKSVFQSVLEDTVQNVYDTQKCRTETVSSGNGTVRRCPQSSNRPGKSRTEPGSYDLS